MLLPLKIVRIIISTVLLRGLICHHRLITMTFASAREELTVMWPVKSINRLHVATLIMAILNRGTQSITLAIINYLCSISSSLMNNMEDNNTINTFMIRNKHIKGDHITPRRQITVMNMVLSREVTAAIPFLININHTKALTGSTLEVVERITTSTIPVEGEEGVKVHTEMVSAVAD